MENRSHSQWMAAGLLGTSLLIHGVILWSFGPLGRAHGPRLSEFQRKLESRKKEGLEFEFVEAPPKVHPQSPSPSVKKISSRNALNQDLLKDKSNAAEHPSVKMIGPADQLAQRRGRPSPSLRGSPPKPSSPGEKAIANALQKGEEVRNAASEEGITPPVSVKKTPALTGSKPQPSMQGLANPDRITTQEMARVKSKGAKLYGFTSFEATGSGMGEYMKHLKEKIWLAWYPYLAFHYPQDYRGADAILSVILDKKGEVKVVRVVESHGSPEFASYCMEAIQRASGFGALPSEILALIGKDELELRFGFHYL